MFQILQATLKETKSKLFLKYDGEREKDKYTIVLYDLITTNGNITKSTDDLLQAYNDVLQQKNIDATQSDFELFLQNFCHLRDCLIKKHGNEIIFVLTVENNKTLEFMTFLNTKGKMGNLTSSDFKEIIEYVVNWN